MGAAREKSCSLRHFRNCREHFLGVMLNLDLRPDFHDLALGVDEEGVAAGDLHHHHAAQRAVGIDDLVLRVGEQPEGQSFFGAELLAAQPGVRSDRRGNFEKSEARRTGCGLHGESDA